MIINKILAFKNQQHFDCGEERLFTVITCNRPRSAGAQFPYSPQNTHSPRYRKTTAKGFDFFELHMGMKSEYDSIALIWFLIQRAIIHINRRHRWHSADCIGCWTRWPAGWLPIRTTTYQRSYYVVYPNGREPPVGAATHDYLRRSPG